MAGSSTTLQCKNVAKLQKSFKFRIVEGIQNMMEEQNEVIIYRNIVTQMFQWPLLLLCLH